MSSADEELSDDLCRTRKARSGIVLAQLAFLRYDLDLMPAGGRIQRLFSARRTVSTELAGIIFLPVNRHLIGTRKMVPTYVT